MSEKINGKKQTHITVDKNMQDYSNEPAFVKAAEKATAFLKKHPLPKDFAQPKKKGK
jgi:hypothetical protein